MRSLFVTILLLLPAMTLLTFQSCSVTRQAQQAAKLADCEFRIVSAQNINLAGVEFQNIHSISDLNITDATLLLGGFASPTMPLSLQLNLEGHNPNSKTAGINRLEWILFVDDIQMTSGIIEKPFAIPGGGTTIIPVDVALDVKQVLSGKSSSSMLNFCMNLAGTGNTPTRFKIKLKPSLMIGNIPISYPGYITVKTDFSGK